MNKLENYKLDLKPLLEEYLKSGNLNKITTYLTVNSALPGRRANLELARAFADMCEVYSVTNLDLIKDLVLGLSQITSDDAPVNSPKEFLPFCGVLTTGFLGAIHPSFFYESLSHIRSRAIDSRWRIREAIAMAIQRLIEKQGTSTLQELESWVSGENWLAMRAVVTGVAEPALLEDSRVSNWALKIHKKVFYHIHLTTNRRSEDFKILTKGLSYTLSVVICALPIEGFEYLYELIDLQDDEILRIVKLNLKKNRMIKNVPEETTNLLKFLL